MDKGYYKTQKKYNNIYNKINTFIQIPKML